MTTNFKIDLDGIEFQFNTMNRIKLQLFQVYVLHEGKKQRFHMQLNEEGKFYMCDKVSCPDIYLHLEKTFAEAIVKLGEVPEIKKTITNQPIAEPETIDAV